MGSETFLLGSPEGQGLEVEAGLAECRMPGQLSGQRRRRSCLYSEVGGCGLRLSVHTGAFESASVPVYRVQRGGPCTRRKKDAVVSNPRWCLAFS